MTSLAIETVAPGIAMRGGRFRWQVMVDGRRKSGTSASLEEAKRCRDAARKVLRHAGVGASGRGADLGWTLGDAVDYTARNPAPGGWLGSAGERKTLINANAGLEYFGRDRLLATIDLDSLEGYVEYLMRQGNSNSTINKKLSAIRKPLTLAKRKKRLDLMPEFPTRLKESSGRKCELERSEEGQVYRLLRQMGKQDHVDAIMTLIDTGMRPVELYALDRRDIDLRSMVILIHGRDGKGTKNGEFRSVPMTKRIKEIMKRRLSDSEVAHPFPYTNDWMRAAWDRVRFQMGRDNDPQFTPYICRHTCASRLVRGGVPLPAVKDWLGHKTIEMTMRYAYLMPKELLRHVHVLDQDDSQEDAA